MQYLDKLNGLVLQEQADRVIAARTRVIPILSAKVYWIDADGEIAITL